jgi:hypothetical protein
MLWIRKILDILVRIRIQILYPGVPLTFGFGSGFLKEHLHQPSKIKSKKRGNKIVETKGFSYFFCLLIEDPDPYK